MTEESSSQPSSSEERFIAEVREAFPGIEYSCMQMLTAVEVHMELRKLERERGIFFDGPYPYRDKP